jgi:hypothetical protein
MNFSYHIFTIKWKRINYEKNISTNISFDGCLGSLFSAAAG